MVTIQCSHRCIPKTAAALYHWHLTKGYAKLTNDVDYDIATLCRAKNNTYFNSCDVDTMAWPKMRHIMMVPCHEVSVCDAAPCLHGCLQRVSGSQS